MITIRIESTTVEDCPAGKDWEKVGVDEKKDPLYGYTPEIIKKREVTKVLLVQNLESIDLEAVIKAVNDIR